MNIKILISCHKPSEYVKNDVLCPIQVGSAQAAERFEGILHDDEGENISSLNAEYCELTAQYWAWKNLSADYYGFFHYRRYLSFCPLKDTADAWGNIIRPYIGTDFVRELGLDEATIQAAAEQYDVILPCSKDIRKMPEMGRTMSEQYDGQGRLYREDLDLMTQILKEKYPDFYPYAQRYEQGHETVFNNIFLMRRGVFCEYCVWLFGLLDAFCQRASMQDYSTEATRTPGHLAERLLNIYCLYLKENTDLRFGELQTVVLENTDPLPCLKPAFSENNVAIALSANDFYAPYTDVLLHSMTERFSDRRNYDILVMHRNISARNRRLLARAFGEKENVSLRFINVSRFEERFRGMYLRGHFALETYFRLLMPELLQDYDKVLYLDCDTIVQADLAELYDTDVSGYLLAACRDADTAGLYNGFEPNKKAYMDNVLKIRCPYDYFQAGIILFNLQEFRKSYTGAQMLEFAASNHWELLDQDVLNYLAQGRVRYISMEWNVMTDWLGRRINEIIARGPKRLYDAYRAARAAPKIIHYAGPDKPWQHPDSDLAEVWWSYARASVYYELLLQRLARREADANLPRARLKRGLTGAATAIADRLFPPRSRRREKLKGTLQRMHIMA